MTDFDRYQFLGLLLLLLRIEFINDTDCYDLITEIIYEYTSENYN